MIQTVVYLFRHLLFCWMLAALASGPVFAASTGSSIVVPADTAQVQDSAAAAAQPPSFSDSIVVQESEQLALGRVMPQKDGESGWDWQAIAVFVSLAIALVGWVLWLYERRKMAQDAADIRNAELKVEEKNRIEHEERNRQKEQREAEERGRTVEEEYFHHLHRVLKNSEIFGFRGIDGADESVGVTETFVPLDIDVESRYENEEQRRETFERTEKDERRYVSPEKALFHTVQSGRRILVIIGEPGSGKTTMIKHFALNRELRLPGCEHLPVMLYMPLRNMAGQGSEGSSMPAVLASVFEPHIAFDPEWVEGRLNQEHAFVLLDGLDEISSVRQRLNVLRWLTKAITTYENAFFVITTRDGGFEKQEQDALKHPLQRAYVQRFTSEQQKVFLENWFREARVRDNAKEIEEGTVRRGVIEESALREAGKLHKYLSRPEKKGMQELAGIPLLLQIMAICWKQEHYLPNDENELYDRALDFLLEGRDRDKEIPVPIESSKAKMLLAPVALWMQDHAWEKPIEDIPKERMHDLVQKGITSDRQLRQLDLSTKEVCHSFASRSGVLVDVGSCYAFRHKTFREYLAGIRLLTAAKDPEYLEKLVEKVGDAAWEEPLLFFMAKVDGVLYSGFLQAFFDSSRFRSLDQSAQTQLQRLILRSSSNSVDVFRTKLYDASTTPAQMLYLLDCLKIIGTPEAAKVARDFGESHPDIDRDVRRKISEVTGAHPGSAHPDAAEVTAEPEEMESEEAYDDKLWYSRIENNAQYVLIQGCETGDFAMAKYPVTNKLYRKFIASIQAMEHGETADLFTAKLQDIAGRTTGFQEYLGQASSLAEQFTSRYDTDRRFKGDDQPVVGVSWYDAAAYCLWLSLMESKGEHGGVYRLPTESEWLYAASGTADRPYPWGKESPTPERANYDENVGATTPVGRYLDGATPEGLYDMGGNVWEWMENWADDDKDVVALRGGSWDVSAGSLRCSARYSSLPQGRLNCYIGFRVVRPSPSS